MFYTKPDFRGVTADPICTPGLTSIFTGLRVRSLYMFRGLGPRSLFVVHRDRQAVRNAVSLEDVVPKGQQLLPSDAPRSDGIGSSCNSSGGQSLEIIELPVASMSSSVKAPQAQQRRTLHERTMRSAACHTQSFKKSCMILLVPYCIR